MSIYQRGKSWYYNFQFRGERYAGYIGQVSKMVGKEVLARKKAEAADGRYSAPAKKQSPLLKEFVESVTIRAAYAKNGASRSMSMNDVLTATLEGLESLR